MKQIKRNIKQAMNALSAAHAGEMLHRRGKQSQLQQHDASPVAAKSPATKAAAMPVAAAVRRKQVALWLKDLPSQAVLDYALSSCQRMDMDLLILHAGKPRAQDLLAAFGDQLENAGVAIDIQPIDGSDEAVLFQYIERTPRIAFLVTGNADALTKPLGQGQAMPSVPVVVLAATEAKAEQDTATRAIAA